MKIIPLFEKFRNDFNKKFMKDVNPLNLESKIRELGDDFTLYLFENLLNYFDESFKNSKERKKEYNIKDTTIKTLVTSIGTIHVNSTAYYTKTTKKRFVPLRDILNLVPYQRLTNEAEYQLIKYAMENNMSKAAKYALKNTEVARCTVSKKISKLKGSIVENVKRSSKQPEILYIEMDEVHANLQHGGNKICPCAIVHEGYVDASKNRKKLKNVHYFASAKLTYAELWEVIFDYVNKKYDIDKFKKIFVSGDGASGIKDYKNCFPNAKFVLDIFHYKGKHLSYIFKKDKDLKELADNYIRNDRIDDFKTLVKAQIAKYPNQEKYMIKHQDYILNNIEGIKNQKDPDYIVHCSMEGHVNQGFARYITSSPYGFSLEGLNNKLKLLVYHNNKVELTLNDFYHLKYDEDEYEKIVIKIRKLCNIRYDKRLLNNYHEYKINTSIPILDSAEDNNKLKELLMPVKAVYMV